MQAKDLTVGMIVGYHPHRDGSAASAQRAIVMDTNRWTPRNPFGRLSGGIAKGSGKGSGIPLMVEGTFSGQTEWRPTLANPANIRGPWDEVVAQAEADAQRTADVNARRRAAQYAHAVAFAADTARAEKFEVSISTSQPTGFAEAPARYTLSRADLLKLLAAAEKET